MFNKNNYLKIELKNAPLNRLAYGAKVTIRTKEKTQTQTLLPFSRFPIIGRTNFAFWFGSR